MSVSPSHVKPYLSFRWLKEFINCGGLNSLFAVLESMHSKPGRRNKHFEIESEMLKILKMIANSVPSFAESLCQQSHVNTLILSLDSPSLMARTATLDFFLFLVTLQYPSGHKLIMTAMEHFKSIRHKKKIFDYLVEALGNAVSARGIFGSKVGATITSGEYSVFGFGTEKVRNPTEKEMREYLKSSVAFIRYLVEKPTEFEYRMHIRQDLISSGILPVFQKLKTWAQSEFEDILQHVNAFESMKLSDFKYLLSNFDAEVDVDLDDPNQLLNLLISRLDQDDKNTVSSFIQNIVVGTALIDSETRSYMLAMIEKVVMYIVLDHNGITEFEDAFKYSVDQIIAGLQEIESLQEENLQLTAICEHQEKQLLSTNTTTLVDLGSESLPPSISNTALLQHRDKLQQIFNVLEGIPQGLPTLVSPATSKVDDQKETVKTVLEKKESNSTVDETVVEAVQEKTESVDDQDQATKPPPPKPIALHLNPPKCGPPPPPVPTAIPTVPMKYKPVTKTRKLHWERVDMNSYETSTWSKLKTYSKTEEKLFKSGILKEVEELFALKNTHEKVETETIKDLEAKVLTQSRAQNIMIFLQTLKQTSMESIVEAIRTFDVERLTETIVNQSINAIPSADEVYII